MGCDTREPDIESNGENGSQLLQGELVRSSRIAAPGIFLPLRFPDVDNLTARPVGKTPLMFILRNTVLLKSPSSYSLVEY